MTLANTGPLAALQAADRSRRRATSAAVVAAALALVPLPLAGSTAAALAVSAALAAGLLLALAWLALARDTQRFAVLHAIADGDGDVPLPAVARGRERLLDEAHRRELADGLRAHAAAARAGALPPGSRRVVRLRAITGAGPELGAVAATIASSAPVQAEGLAACELLLVDGACSPLYGTDPEALREELDRIAELLGASGA